MIQDRMYSITLQKLRIFAAVARERSFVKAADAVFLSSPTVSEEIRSLENIVGLKLVNRSRGRRLVELTEAGAILLESYNEISQSMIKAGKSLDAFKRLERGSVTFGTDVIFGGYLLPLLHDTFCRIHPGISVRVEVDSGPRILEGLRQGRIDLAVLLVTNQEAGFVHEPLVPCHVVPVGPPVHRLAGGAPARFGELARERLLLPDRSANIRKILDRMAAQAGVPLNVAMEVGNIDANLQAALSGLGVTIMSTHCVVAEVTTGRLSILRVEGFPIIMEWFVLHPEARLTPSVEALKLHLLQSRGLLESPLPLPPQA